MPRAALYDRASEPGGYVHAEEAHFNAARQAARQQGWALVMYRHENKKGGKLNRQGLEDIRQAARLRQIDILIVDSMARLGRRGWPRLCQLEGFDHLGVKVFVASKGRFDEPGVIRYVEAWQDEQYLRDQAAKTIAMMPHAVKAGKHPGPDPIGYLRVYEVSAEPGKKPTSRLVKHAEYAPVVQGAFADFDHGKSIMGIVHDLNSSRVRNPKSHDGAWTCGTIRAMLQRKVYLGVVEWGRTHPGEWGKYEGCLEEEGEHEALVSPELFDRVQARLQERKGPRRMNQRGKRTPLLDGLIVCRGCGGHVYAGGRHADAPGCQYVCAGRHRGTSPCREPSISVQLAEEAVLQQVRRLSTIPWEPQAFDAAVRRDPYEPERRRLRALVSADEQELENNARAYVAAGDFGPEVTAAFRKVADEVKLRLRHHQDQLAALPEWHVDTVKAKQVHELLIQRDIPTFVTNARARGHAEVLRDILQCTVSRARIVARGSRSGQGRQSTWAKAEVEWTPEVQLLLDAGRLVLAPDVPTPAPATKQEMAAERARRYRARKRQRGERTASA
jgi:DNA invertase Pin-like site-specific DNA recombinase